MASSLIPAGVADNVERICAEVVAAANADGRAVRNVWGYGPDPDHNNRRCLDFMIFGRAHGDAVATYLWRHRERLGLDLLIWHRRIRRTYRKGLIPAGLWAPYRGASAHTDHVHAQFAAGPYRPLVVKHLPAYVVDPRKVSTWLWQVRADGSNGEKRPPGYRITTGVRVITVDGRKWLQTEAGNRYALHYLRRT